MTKHVEVIEPSEDYEHPPHRQRRRSALKRFVALGAFLALGAISTACYMPAHGHGTWQRLADCESGDVRVPGSANWQINTGNGFSGGLQFTRSSWDAVRDPWWPTPAYLATVDQQKEGGVRLQRMQGWGAWPDCSRKLGLR